MKRWGNGWTVVQQPSSLLLIETTFSGKKMDMHVLIKQRGITEATRHFCTWTATTFRAGVLRTGYSKMSDFSKLRGVSLWPLSHIKTATGVTQLLRLAAMEHAVSQPNTLSSQVSCLRGRLTGYSSWSRRWQLWIFMSANIIVSFLGCVLEMVLGLAAPKSSTILTTMKVCEVILWKPFSFSLFQRWSSDFDVVFGH